MCGDKKERGERKGRWIKDREDEVKRKMEELDEDEERGVDGERNM